MKKFCKKIYFVLILTFIFGPISVFAGGQLGNAPQHLEDVRGKAGFHANASLESVVGTIIQVVLGLTGLIFFALMTYAGYLWLTARGESSQVQKSKDIIITAIIGLILTLGAYALTVLIGSQFQT